MSLTCRNARTAARVGAKASGGAVAGLLCHAMRRKCVGTGADDERATGTVYHHHMRNCVWLRGPFFGGLMVLAGCGSSTSAGTSNPRCTPNATQACTCVGGQLTGAQSCLLDGAGWTTCQCPSDGDGGGDVDAASDASVDGQARDAADGSAGPDAESDAARLDGNADAPPAGEPPCVPDYDPIDCPVAKPYMYLCPTTSSPLSGCVRPPAIPAAVTTFCCAEPLCLPYAPTNTGTCLPTMALGKPVAWVCPVTIPAPSGACIGVGVSGDGSYGHKIWCCPP